MFRHLIYLILLTIIFNGFSGLAQGRNHRGYLSFTNPLPNHSNSKTHKNRFLFSLRSEQKVFNNHPSGSKFNSTFARNLKRESRGFGRGITKGAKNSLPVDRHSQGVGQSRNFLFLFPGKKKFYRGHRSRLGLYRMK